MLNNVTLVGRLTKDLDLRYTPTGVAVANGTLAVNRPFKNANGEQEADFIRIIIWRQQAENSANFLRKGSLMGVKGRIETRSYDGQDGKRVFVTEVIAEQVAFLEPKNANNGNRGNTYQQNQQGYQQNQSSNQKPMDDPFSNNGGTVDISDDDLPF